VTALLVTILSFVMMDAKGPINCQAILSLINVSAFLTMFASSLLIVLRIIAIWNKNKIVVATAFSIWVVNGAFFLQRVVQLRSVWVPAQQSCAPESTKIIQLNLIAMLVTDIALLLIMLIGLLRLRVDGGGAFGLAQLLWRQGVIWLLLATAAEVPPVVLASLDLNVPFNIMLQPPSWATLTIAATRMHRALVVFASSSTDAFSAPKFTSLPVPGAMRINTPSRPTNCMQVAVHVVSEQHGIQEMRDEDSCDTANEGMYAKPNGLSCEDDVERGA